jgi:hypothetical protein
MLSTENSRQGPYSPSLSVSHHPFSQSLFECFLLMTDSLLQADDGAYASLISDMINALLKFNQISVEEGFHEFDCRVTTRPFLPRLPLSAHHPPSHKILPTSASFYDGHDHHILDTTPTTSATT